MSDLTYEEPEQEELRLTPRSLHRASLRSGAYWPTASGLIFLLFFIIPAWQEQSPARAMAATVLALVFGVLYLYATGLRAYPVRDRVLWLAATWAVVGLIAVVIGSDTVYMVMYLVIVHAVLLPWRAGRIAVVVVGLAGLAGAIALRETFAVFLAVAGIILALMLGFGIQRSALTEQLERAEKRSAMLAVFAERERIGRDLHDILGHSLTTITVSAQLAQRLIDADPAAARRQIAEVERISRQALADVRATASGMQQVRAATEISSARSVLAAAGIEVEAPVTVPALSEEQAELFGYVIREGVTNVVRHSRATRCRIALDERSAEVADDGVGVPAGTPFTGLAGLRRRVESAGGVLRVDAPPDRGTALRAELPAATGGAA